MDNTSELLRDFWSAFDDVGDPSSSGVLPSSSDEGCGCADPDVHLLDGWFMCRNCGVLLERPTVLDYATECRVEASGCRHHVDRCASWRRTQDTFIALASVACAQGIPKSILEDAKSVFDAAIQTGIFRGACRRGLVAASVYVACKKNKVPRSAAEVSAMFDVPRSVLTLGYNAYAATQDSISGHETPSTPQDYVKRFCTRLNLGRDVEDRVSHLVSRAMDRNVAGAPNRIAAAAIAYMCCGAGRSRKSVSSQKTETEAGLQRSEVSRVCQVAPRVISRIVTALSVGDA